MRHRLIALAAGFLCAASAAFAAENLNNYDTRDSLFEDKSSEWKEIEAPLPPFPSDRNLVQLQMGTRDTHRYFVDSTSVSLGTDGVMRYTFVVKTAGGATNVSFEGIRCDTRERKIYASGRSDGTWASARDPQWRWIERNVGVPVHYSLWREYFCAERKRPTPPQRAVDAIRRGTPLPGGPTTIGG